MGPTAFEGAPRLRHFYTGFDFRIRILSSFSDSRYSLAVVTPIIEATRETFLSAEFRGSSRATFSLTMGFLLLVPPLVSVPTLKGFGTYETNFRKRKTRGKFKRLGRWDHTSRLLLRPPVPFLSILFAHDRTFLSPVCSFSSMWCSPPSQ
jgi:hypothetical protein